MSTIEKVRWTSADLELLPDNGNRYEIVEGELVVTRAPRWEHQNVANNACVELTIWSRQTQLGKAVQVPGIIFTDGDNVIPDVVWVSNERLAEILDESGYLRGAPELVIEVMSPGEESEKRDRQSKLKLYSVQGVREYWIFDIVQQKVEVYRFWGNHELDLDQVRDGLVVAGLSKLYSRAKRSIQFINRLGYRSSLVIIDEAHQAIAETYKLVLDSLVLPYEHTALLGLTATPGRTWADISADEELAEFFAQRKVTLEVPGYDNPVDYLVSEQYLARVTYRSLLNESGLNLSNNDLKRIEEELELPKNILIRLAENEQRNLRIILEIENLAKNHKRILVFAISVEHSKLLAAVLQARNWQASTVTAKTPALERERIIARFKDDNPDTKIICNYGVLTTGFDAPRTSAAVIARPTKSLVLYSQMVGRAIRGLKAGGNEQAEIVTVVDTDLPGFGSVADAFNNWEDIWRLK